MKSHLRRLRSWWTIGRHVAALKRSGLVAVDTAEHRRHVADSLAFYRWATASGALNDGRATRRTRKLVHRYAEVVVESIPLPWGF